MKVEDELSYVRHDMEEWNLETEVIHVAGTDIKANHVIYQEVEEEIDLVIDLEAEQMQRYLMKCINW